MHLSSNFSFQFATLNHLQPSAIRSFLSWHLLACWKKLCQENTHTLRVCSGPLLVNTHGRGLVTTCSQANVIYSLSLSSRYFVRTWRSIRWKSRCLHCSVEGAAPQHGCICFLLFAFCLVFFYLSMSVFFSFNT